MEKYDPYKQKPVSDMTKDEKQIRVARLHRAIPRGQRQKAFGGGVHKGNLPTGTGHHVNRNPVGAGTRKHALEGWKKGKLRGAPLKIEEDFRGQDPKKPLRKKKAKLTPKIANTKKKPKEEEVRDLEHATERASAKLKRWNKKPKGKR